MPNKFKFSNGWFIKFKNRNNLVQRTICGESKSLNETFITQELVKIQSIVVKYNPEDVYNGNESGLFYRMFPNKTLAHKNEDVKGFKTYKDRITVLFLCNAVGTVKFKPLIIGKFKKPMSFRNIDITKFNLRYTHSSNAWITKNIWQEYILYIDSLCKANIIINWQLSTSYFRLWQSKS